MDRERVKALKITINGQEIEVTQDENLVDVALRLGVHVPHFCYHPGLSVAGNCRQCLVEVEGARKPQIACNTPLKEGMVVRTDTPEIEEARRGVLEFLLLNHPIDCPICDQAGECRLQEYYMAHGLYDSRRNVDKVHKPKVVDLGPNVLLDAERCVLCTRCVRFCEEIAGVEELYVAERGHESEIATFPGKKLENAYSGNVVDICPVGALLNKEFRFKSRVWWLKKADSICSSCARGCNVRVDQHWNQVQRVVPRENPEVNKYWMCDRGRSDFAWVNENRLEEPSVAGEPVSLRIAFEKVTEAFEQLDGDITVVLSPKLSNEDLLAMLHFFRKTYPAKNVLGGSLEPPQEEDEILRRADPHPNSWAIRALGLEGNIEEAIRGTTTAGLFLVGDDPLQWDPSLEHALAKYSFVAASLTNRNATARAIAEIRGVLFPLATHLEQAGTFSNFEGRVQRFEPVLSLYGASLPAHRIAAEMARAMQKAFWPPVNSPAELLQKIWERFSPDSDTFPNIDWQEVPVHGLVANWQQTANPTSTMSVPDRTGSGFGNG